MQWQIDKIVFFGPVGLVRVNMGVILLNLLCNSLGIDFHSVVGTVLTRIELA